MVDGVSNWKSVEICPCMWDYLRLTIPPRIKLPRIAAITRKLPRSSLFSYQIIWMAGGGGWFFFSFTCPIPLSEICWNPFYIRFFFCDTFRVFEILSRSLAMGHRKEIFELDLCGSIFFFFKSLPTSQKLCW